MVYLCAIVGWILLRPNSRLQKRAVTENSIWTALARAVFIVGTIILLVWPMKLASRWNGKIPEWRNQYEVMARALRDGHIDLNYDDVDPRLEEMENPYDPEARKEAGVKVHWDSAYYKGKYYLYFGIVPVLLLFLPHLLIRGTSLVTWKATAIFSAFIVLGLFALLRLIARRFYPRMTQGLLLVLSTACSFLSLWYATAAPALYCTAIVAAIAMMVWSFYFYFRAVFVEQRESLQGLWAFLGGVCGALAAGCRPPIAVANLLAVPLVITFLRTRKVTSRTIRHVVYAILPYIVVAACLMVYNYVRFENPFEFGQVYQMTVADQHAYGSLLETFSLSDTLKGLQRQFLRVPDYKRAFPWLRFGGAYFNFPILLASFLLFLPGSVKSAHREKWFGTQLMLLALPFIISTLDVLWSPYLLERYRMDIYWLMAIAAFIALAAIYERIRSQRAAAVFRGVVTAAAMVTILCSVLFFLVPNDANYTQEVPEALDKIRRIMFLIP